MARPISYDPEAALDRAVDLFWTRGYQALSVDDIVRETGINRHSLYSRYGNKYGLLQAALDRYCENTLAHLRAAVTVPGTPRQRLEALYRLRLPDVADAFWSRMLQHGCFGIRVVSELREERPELAQLGTVFSQALEGLLTPIVREGQERGEFRSDLPPQTLASVLAVGFMAPLILPADEARNRAFLAILG
jgi:TetR/AcrR family transcriptional regulator, transcriptional repressor for nem operon